MNRDVDSVTDLSKARRGGLACVFGGLLFSFRFAGLNPPAGARGWFWLLPGFAIWSGRVPPHGRGRCLPVSSLT